MIFPDNYRAWAYDGTVKVRCEGAALVRKVRSLIDDLDCAGVVSMSSGTSLELMLCEVSPHFGPLMEALEGALDDAILMHGCKVIWQPGMQEVTSCGIPSGAWPV